ncbi:MAG: Fic family protein [Cyclobacteriaceae bacterium]|nr:Fic family protein [Cyclobacteriaceae bacterium]
MDKFQYKLNFDFKTNQKILKLISYIDSFKGKWNVVEQKENVYLKELRKIATIESIGSSTRIEGAKLTNEEIKELLDNIEITKLKTRDQQEVVGYYDVLEIIYESYNEISISKNYIQQLHQRLLKYSTKDNGHRGIYKNLSNKVVANYPDGTQKVIFNTTEPHLVENEMTDLIVWTNQQLKIKEIHPLVIIGLFIYEFLSIHPFQDGNGRLSRLLTNLLLLKNDYQFIQYVSFENLIEQKKKSYYEALMDGQKDRYSDNEQINSWSIFFLSSLETLIQRLEQKYDVFKSKGGYLNDRQKIIKKFIEKEQPIKLADLVKAIPEISIHTLKKDLQYLKTERIIDSIGKNRGTIYMIKEK